MANVCFIDIKANGKKKDLLKFMEIVTSPYNYEENADGTMTETKCKYKHLVGVSDMSFNTDELLKVSDEDITTVTVTGSGGCRWSVCVSATDYYSGSYYNHKSDNKTPHYFKATHLRELSKELSLEIEAQGNCDDFKERYVFNCGDTKTFETYDDDEPGYKTIQGFII